MDWRIEMDVEEIERIVALISKTGSTEVRLILINYLRWNLMPPMTSIPPGSFKEP